jgi:hypothetical protein
MTNPNSTSPRDAGEYFTADSFESSELIDFFQCYRHAPITDQELTCKTYELLKFEISNVANARVAPLLEALKEAKEMLQWYQNEHPANPKGFIKQWLIKVDGVMNAK